MSESSHSAATVDVPGASCAIVRSSPSKARTFVALVLLVLLPLALRVAPIGHGMPRNYVPDSHVVRSALGMLRDKNPVPPVGKYSTYPNLLPYMLVPIYAAHFAAGMASGAWSGPAEYGEALTADPSTAHLLARLLVALFGALTPLVVFKLARELGLGRGAWVATLLVSTSLLHVHFSVQERPWVPMAFFFALSAWAAAVHGRRGDTRSLVLSGAAAGLAFACHQAGLPSALLPALAWAFGPVRWSGADLARRAVSALACAAAFAVLALLLGHPYLLVYGPTGTDAVVGGDAVDISFGGQGLRFGFRAESAQRLGLSLLTHDPVLVMLALAGLFAALRRRAARPIVVFMLAWLLFFGFHENDKIRYLLPGVVLLALPAGFVAERWTNARGGVAVAAVLIATPLVQSLRLGALLMRDDTRAVAEALVPARLPAGARLAIDRYGPAIELDTAGLERLADLRKRAGSELGTRERARLERLRAGDERLPGLDAVFLSDLFEFVERETLVLEGTAAVKKERGVHVRKGLEGLGATPTEVLERLGITHVLIADRDDRAGAGHLLGAMVAGRAPLAVVDPWGDSRARGEASLPMELDRPLLALWSLERPGPWLGLFEFESTGAGRR